MNPLIHLKATSPLLITLTLLCFALLPKAQGVVPPPPGGYPNFTTAAGDHALQALTLGVGNTAIGTFSLFTVTTGSFNTAIGAGALDLNTADSNTATGAAALLFNTTGAENTANGTAALEFNESGSFNTATGAFALFNNTEGTFNCAFGWQAMLSNVSGGSNTAIGNTTLQANATGFSNTAIGGGALTNNTSGSSNTALGVLAGSSQTTGSSNVYIGAAVSGLAGESSTTRIRNVGSTPIVGGTTVVVDGTGGDGDQRLGFLSSSRRYKQEIEPMEKASESLFALNPVTFRAKGNTSDSARVKHYGLIAEEVAGVDPDLVVFNPEGKPETLRFDSINAMLLNEFLKEHRTVQELKSVVAKQEAIAAQQQKQIEALTAGLQRVSAQLELSKSAPQTVLNDQ
jgi:Chaperone of endosialidase